MIRKSLGRRSIAVPLASRGAPAAIVAARSVSAPSIERLSQELPNPLKNAGKEIEQAAAVLL